jgi:iron complex outermembrane recepter protein
MSCVRMAWPLAALMALGIAQSNAQEPAPPAAQAPQSPTPAPSSTQLPAVTVEAQQTTPKAKSKGKKKPTTAAVQAQPTPAADVAPAAPPSNPNSTMTAPPVYGGGQVASGGQVGILGNRDFMDTPFNQTSYTAELMKNQQSHFIADALKNDPAVRIDASSSTGLDNFIVRGFDVSNGDILFNGLMGVAPSFFNSMMSESVERVEVLKGPNALLNGLAQNDSLGGAINIVPKRAGDTPLTQFTPDFMMDGQFGGHLDFGRRYGARKEFGARINAVYRAGDTAIDHQERESQLLAAGLDYQGERLRVSTDLGYQYQDLMGPRRFVTVNAAVVPSAPDSRSNYFAPWERTAPEVLYGAVNVEYDLAENITAFASAGGNHREHDIISINRTINNANGNLAAGNVQLRADRMENHTAVAGLRGTFDMGVISHQVVVAHTETAQDWYSARLNYAVPASNIYNPVFGAAPAASVLPNANNAPKQND